MQDIASSNLQGNTEFQSSEDSRLKISQSHLSSDITGWRNVPLRNISKEI